MKTSFSDYIRPGKKGHLIGIGGVSMSPLAEVLHDMGLVIKGSDISESEKVSSLRKKGIEIDIGHSAGNIGEDTDFIVRTAAARDDNVEVLAARKLNIPVFERTEAWGTLMKDYKNAVCVSGTHGKTTTTSMVTHILMAAEHDPTVMLGGTLPLLQASHRIGKGETIILEACEYYNSFLSFSPTIAVILNVDSDHLDFFKDLDDIKNSFHNFAKLVPEHGFIVANGDDANTMSAISGINRQVITFGTTESSDVFAKNVTFKGASTSFDVFYKGEFFQDVRLNVPGMHNVYNALAATAAAICIGVSPISVKYGLAGFTGAGRRFEFKGKYNGADVYDDYAHHPRELKAILDAVEPLGYKRVVAVFQPHTYTRTNALFDDFVEQLKRPDLLYLTEIYAAREQNTLGISSADIAREIPNSQFFAEFSELEESLKWTASPGDLILTIGAGDVFQIGEHIVK